MDQGGQEGAIRWMRLSRRSFAANPFALSFALAATSPILCATAFYARTDQGRVADDAQGKADQDRRVGGGHPSECRVK